MSGLIGSKTDEGGQSAWPVRQFEMSVGFVYFWISRKGQMAIGALP